MNKIYGHAAGEGKVRWAGVKIKPKSEECKGCKAEEVKEEQRVRCEMGTEGIWCVYWWVHEGLRVIGVHWSKTLTIWVCGSTDAL